MSEAVKGPNRFRIHVPESIVFGICLIFPVYAWFTSVVHRVDNNVPFIQAFFVAAAVNCVLQCLFSVLLRREPGVGPLDVGSWGNSFWLTVLFGPAVVAILLITSPKVTDVGLLGRVGQTNWDLLAPWTLVSALVSLLLMLLAMVTIVPIGYVLVGLLPAERFERLRERNDLPNTRVQTLCMAGILPLIFVVSTCIAGSMSAFEGSEVRHGGGFVMIVRFLLFQGSPMWEIGGWVAIAVLVVLIVVYVRSGRSRHKVLDRRNEGDSTQS